MNAKHHSLAARQMERDVAGGFVDILAVRHEICASECLGCGETLASAQVVDDLAKQLEAYAGLAELRSYAKSDDVAKRVTLADATPLRGDRRSKEPGPIPRNNSLELKLRELRSFLGRKVGGCDHRL